MIKAAKSKIFDQLDPSTPKPFWKTAKYQTKQKTSIPVLKDSDGQAVTDDAEKATLLITKYFNTTIPGLKFI